MIDTAFIKNKEGNFDISPQEWFTKMTVVINLLKDVEDFSINFIEKEMNNKISTILPNPDINIESIKINS